MKNCKAKRLQKMEIKVAKIVGMSLLTKRPSGQYCRNGSGLSFTEVVNIAGIILLSNLKGKSTTIILQPTSFF
jgi:hypothetical protein